MTTIYTSDANTGNLIPIDTENPSGLLNVVDADTGDIVELDLANLTGMLHVNDADTGEIVTIDYSNPSGILNVNDPNTGEIVEIDLANPAGTLYSVDANTGEFVELDLSVDKFINTGGFALPIGGAEADTTAPTVESFIAITPNIGGTISITEFTASEPGVSFIITDSDTLPELDAAGWSETVPTEFESESSVTLYPWVKDSSGNISDVYGSPAVVEVYEIPAYTNAGGMGDRRSIVTASTTVPEIFDVPTLLVEGSRANGFFFLANADITGMEIKFDFGHAVLITEATYYRGGAECGTWKTQISVNNSDWTDVGDQFLLANALNDPQIIDLSENDTPARYLRFVGISGSTTANEEKEVEFEIGNPLA